MNWGGVLCMWSQQSSTNTHGRYNKSIRADRELRGSCLYHPPLCTQIRTRINRPSLSERRRSFPDTRKAQHWDFDINPYSFCNLQIIVDSPPPPRDFFFQFEFSRKIFFVSFVLCFIFSRTHNLRSTLPSLVVGIDRLIAHGENSPPQVPLLIDSTWQMKSFFHAHTNNIHQDKLRL